MDHAQLQNLIESIIAQDDETATHIFRKLAITSVSTKLNEAYGDYESRFAAPSRQGVQGVAQSQYGAAESAGLPVWTDEGEGIIIIANLNHEQFVEPGALDRVMRRMMRPHVFDVLSTELPDEMDVVDLDTDVQAYPTREMTLKQYAQYLQAKATRLFTGIND